MPTNGEAADNNQTRSNAGANLAGLETIQRRRDNTSDHICGELGSGSARFSPRCPAAIHYRSLFLQAAQQWRTVIATITGLALDPPVEVCLAEFLDYLGIAAAHFAGRSLADLQGFIATHPERIASLTLVCSTVLNPRSLTPLGPRLLVVTGDHGLGTRRVRAALPDPPEPAAVVLKNYSDLT